MSYSKSQTKNKLGEISFEEQSVLDTLVQLNIEQFDELLRTTDIREFGNQILFRQMEEIAGTTEAGVEAFTQEAQLDLFNDQIQAERQASEAQREFTNQQIELMRGGFSPSPEQQAAIQESADRAVAAAEQDILRGSRRAIEQISREVSPALGLRPGDTPIINRMSNVAEQATSDIAATTSRIRSQQAQQEATLPLQTSQVMTQQQGLQEQAKQFQNTLRASRQLNLEQLARGAQPGGAIIGQGTPAQNLSVARVPRLAEITSTTRAGGFSSTEGIQVAGTIMQGIGMSSREWKEELGDANPEEILAALAALPIHRWKYSDWTGVKGDEHVGPYAEDFRKTLGVGDGRFIDLLDAVGVLFAAVKALAEKKGRCRCG
jgi:hypothetical protein